MMQTEKRTTADGAAKAEALVGSLRTARGAARERIEAEILAMGGDAVGALARALDRGFTSAGKRVGVAWFIVAYSMILFVAFISAGHAFAWVFAVAGLATALFIATRIEADCLRLLLQIDDPRAIAPLVSVLYAGLSGPNATEIQQRLIFLLPRLSREDAHHLPPETRRKLRDSIDHLRDTYHSGGAFPVDLVVALIKGLVQIGDQDVRLHLVWAREDVREPIRDMAEKGVAELDRQRSEAKAAHP